MIIAQRNLIRCLPVMVVGLLLIGCSQQAGDDTQQVASSEKAPGLKRQPEWIEAKIQRKEKKAKQGATPQSPKERAIERYHDRAGDDEMFSYERVLQASQQASTMPELQVDFQSGLRDAGIWQWQWLGPGNIGGRIRSIVIHPTQHNRMWVGGVSGGIWYTENNGTSWSPVNDFLPTLSVSTMIMSPADPDVMYIGTGEELGGSGNLRGAGIFKSTDGGVTWNQLTYTALWSGVNRIAIDPNNDQEILAATDLGLYRNAYGGQGSWTKEWPTSGFEPVLDVKFDEESNGGDSWAVAGLGDGRALYSDDSGRSWDEATFTGTICCAHLDAAFSPDGDSEPDNLTVSSTDGFVVGDAVEVAGAVDELVKVVSIVNGSTLQVEDLAASHSAWSFVCTQRAGRVELGVRPGSVIFASMDTGGGTLWRSTDHGQTYSLVASAEDTPNYFISDEDPNSSGQGGYDNAVWIAPNDSDFLVVGGIDLWRSEDGGVTLNKISNWRQYDSGTSAHADQHIILHHPDYDGTTNKTVFVGNDGGIQKAVDIKSGTLGALGWTNLANNLGITQFYHGSVAANGDIYGGAQDNGILKLAAGDSAQEWFQCITCSGDGGPSAVHPDFNNIVYASTQRLGIQRSNNWGNSYLPYTTGLDDSDDPNNTRFIAPMTMNPAEPGILVAGGSRIWKSNALNTWDMIRDRIPSSGKCSAIDFSQGAMNLIYAGYDDGTVSHTTSDHQSWVNVDDNGPLPDRLVTDIAVNPENEAELYVTFGGYRYDNVWYSDDFGFTWQCRCGSGLYALPSVHVNTVTFHPNKAGWIYVGTDLGVFASEDGGITWNQTPRFDNVEHDGPVNTEVSDLFWRGSYLIAATHGRGMWQVRPLATIYADPDHTGTEDGSYLFPYNSVREGFDAAGNGSLLLLREGTYYESGDITVNKRMEINVEGTVIIR